MIVALVIWIILAIICWAIVCSNKDGVIFLSLDKEDYKKMTIRNWIFLAITLPWMLTVSICFWFGQLIIWLAE